MSHHPLGHTEMEPPFKVSSERPEKWGIDVGIPELVVQHNIHYTTASPLNAIKMK